MLHVITQGARTLGSNMLVEVCALLDRLGRIAAVGGAILGIGAAWQGEWTVAGLAGLAGAAGLLAVGLASRALPD